MEYPELDCPSALTGGSDLWDTPAGQIVAAEFFAPSSTTSYTLTADAGSFAAAGQAANTLRGLKVAADPGAYSLIGQAASTLYGRKVAADAGAFSAAGGDTEYRQYQFYPGNAFADFAINGAAIHDVADANKTLSVDSGTYAATCGNVSL